MARDVARLIAVLAVELARREPLRAEGQHIVAAELQQVRTLPHIAEAAQARRRLAQKLPTFIRLTVDEHRATRRVLVGLRADDEITPAVARKEERIAEMRRVAWRIRGQRKFFLFHMAVGLQSAKALRRGAHALRVLGIAGVEHAHALRCRKAAAGVATVLVVCIIRPERELRRAVVHEVARMHVSPALILVLTAIGIPLIENVVLTVIETQPVGVVDESERHLQMEPVMPAMTEGQVLRQLRVDGLFIEFLHPLYTSIKETASRCPPEDLSVT